MRVIRLDNISLFQNIDHAVFYDLSDALRGVFTHTHNPPEPGKSTLGFSAQIVHM